MRKMTLITGASSGLGKDFALEYAKIGQDLILVARRLDRLQKLKTELEALYPITVLVYRVDLSDPIQTQAFLDQLPADLFVYRLINNAGFGYHGVFGSYPQDIVTSMIEVNIAVVTKLVAYFIPKMKEQNEGEILNVASMAAFTPGPYMAEYYATKAYVLSFSMALHEELKPYGIKVSASCPGPTRTEFGQAAQYKHNDGIEKKMSMASLTVVKMSMKALEKNRNVAVPGLVNQFLRGLMLFIPKNISAKVIKAIQKQRF